MSERAQFDGMRVHHDEHRRLTQNHDYRSWRDCDTCIAIAVVDELDARITAAEKVVERVMKILRDEQNDEQSDLSHDHLSSRRYHALHNIRLELAALTDATEQGHKHWFIFYRYEKGGERVDDPNSNICAGCGKRVPDATEQGPTGGSK